jgi:hypothetical protein
MENTFFYTFSTISQTLAGAIALLAAFVLYRLQSLNANIDSIAERLTSWVEMICQQEPRQVDGMNVRQLHGREQYRELHLLSNRIKVPENFYQADLERERLPILLRSKDSLLRRFACALCLTVGLIIFSVFALTVTPCMAVSSKAPMILTGAVVWFIVCMATYVWLLWNAFR